MSARTPRPLVEARRIARDGGLLVVDKGGYPAPIHYIYRKLPDGRLSFLGKRGTAAGLRAYVARLVKTRTVPS